MLQDLKDEIQTIVGNVKNSEETFRNNAKKYYQTYIKLAFIQFAYKKLLDDLKQKYEIQTSEFHKNNLNNEISKIDKIINTLETSKNLLKMFALQEQNIAKQLILISYMIEQEYNESLFVVCMVMHSLISQEKVNE